MSAEILERFDLFLLDQWGVLHDGVAPYDGVVETLRHLKTAGKTIIIVSNSGQRAEVSANRLTKLGIGADLYDGMLTSGEAAWQDLSLQKGRSGYVISRDGTADILDGSGCHVTDEITKADFLLIAGIADDASPDLAEYRPVLAQAVEMGLLGFCSNVDEWAIGPNGKRPGPGQIAHLFEAMGGIAFFYGKPDPDFIETALGMAAHIPPERAVMIGDSLGHDIKGANNAEIASILITNGVHRDEWAEHSEQLCRDYDATPDFVVANLRDIF